MKSIPLSSSYAFQIVILSSFSLLSITNAICTSLYPEWWRSTVSYQIYPRSFQDSDGDGVGDIRGIISRLDYFTYLGIETLWISPMYKSPMIDFGYDIYNFTQIDPLFGTLEDFEDLMIEAHQRGLHIIMDFVPNHSSDTHPWFQKSLKKQSPYTDYYVWHDGNSSVPPNNWLSVFGKSSWTWYEERNQWNYHAFLKSQPDLNYEYEPVLEEMKNVVKYWMDLGIDGMRYDAAINLMEDQRFLDEPRSFDPDAKPGECSYLKHIYTNQQPKMFPTLKQFSDLIKSYERLPKQYKMIVSEAYVSPQMALEYYERSNIDMPFNFDLFGLNSKSNASSYASYVTSWMDVMSRDRWPNWVTGNHDTHRLTGRFGENFVDAIHMLIFLLPGTPHVYYGDELGMFDVDISYEDTQDPWGINAGPDRYQIFSRDPQRSPMQWDPGHMSGFTTANKSWLPVNPDYKERNVKIQKNSQYSHLSIYRSLIHLRKDGAFRANKEIYYGPVTGNIYSFGRLGNSGFFVIINVGTRGETYPSEKLPDAMKNYASKIVLITGNLRDSFSIGDIIDLKKLKLYPGQGLVLTNEPGNVEKNDSEIITRNDVTRLDIE